jgi:hypothetical protein
MNAISERSIKLPGAAHSVAPEAAFRPAPYQDAILSNPKFDVFLRPSQLVLDVGRAMQKASEKLGLFGR